MSKFSMDDFNFSNDNLEKNDNKDCLDNQNKENESIDEDQAYAEAIKNAEENASVVSRVEAEIESYNNYEASKNKILEEENKPTSIYDDFEELKKQQDYVNNYKNYNNDEVSSKNQYDDNNYQNDNKYQIDNYQSDNNQNDNKYQNDNNQDDFTENQFNESNDEEDEDFMRDDSKSYEFLNSTPNKKVKKVDRAVRLDTNNQDDAIFVSKPKNYVNYDNNFQGYSSGPRTNVLYHSNFSGDVDSDPVVLQSETSPNYDPITGKSKEEVNIVEKTIGEDYEAKLKEKQQRQYDEQKRLIANQAILRNPFFFDNFEGNKYVTSIEDFIVKFKKDDYKFGDLIRKGVLPKRKVKKAIKLNFKTWKESIDQRLDNDLVNGTDQLTKAQGENILVVKVKRFKFILAFIALVLCGILLTDKIPFLGTRSPIELFIINLVIPLTIGSIILGTVLNKTNKNHLKINKYSKKQYSKRLSALRREFNKKFSTTSNYYRNAYSKGFKKPPLPIEKTAVGESKFKDIEKVVDQANTRIYKQEKKQGGYKLVRFLVNTICWLCFLFTVGDAIYGAVMSLLQSLRG